MNGLAARMLPYALSFFSSLCIMILELVASRLVASCGCVAGSLDERDRHHARRNLSWQRARRPAVGPRGTTSGVGRSMPWGRSWP